MDWHGALRCEAAAAAGAEAAAATAHRHRAGVVESTTIQLLCMVV